MTASTNATAGGQITAILPSQLKYPPYREPDFELAITTAINVARQTLNILEKSPRGTPENLIKEAKKLATYRIPKEKRIGFVGNSGHGKSSTLNSVLEQQGLAKTEASGSAVTPFAVEYRFRQPKHQAPFTLDCTLMLGEELGEYLGRLLSDYRSIDLADPQELISNFEELHADSNAAKDVFDAAFGSMEGFDLTMLDHDDDYESRQNAINVLRSYSRQLSFPEDVSGDGTWVKESHTAGQCQELQSLLLDRGLWPFVKRLTIYSDISILNRGLSLIDLPGYQDTNLARVRAAKKTQAKCDYLCVVATIGRAVDNPVIPQTLESMRLPANASDASAPSVAIICTHAGDLSDKRPLEKLADQAQLRQAKADVLRVEADSESYGSVADYKKATRLTQTKLDALLINSRNDKVQADLNRKYGHLGPSGRLEVFCIDNLRYSQANCEEEEGLSGIPQLRQYLEDLPAEPLFREKDQFITNRIPALVGSFMTWLEASRIDVEAEKRPPLPAAYALELSQVVVEQWAKNMNEVFDKTIDDGLEKGTETIISKCWEVAKSWERYSTGSVSCMVKHRGTHRTPSLGFKCWNTELVRCFNGVMEWSEYHVGINPFNTNLKRAILSPWRDYEGQCRKLEAPPNFLKSLERRLDTLSNSIDDAITTYKKGARKVMLDADSAHPGSYIIDCMLEAYDEASRLTGKSAFLHLKVDLTQDRAWTNSETPRSHAVACFERRVRRELQIRAPRRDQRGHIRCFECDAERFAGRDRGSARGCPSRQLQGQGQTIQAPPRLWSSVRSSCAQTR